MAIKSDFIKKKAVKTLTIDSQDVGATVEAATVTASIERSPLFVQQQTTAIEQPKIRTVATTEIVHAQHEVVRLYPIFFGEPAASVESPYVSIDSADRGDMTFVLVVDDNSAGTGKHIEWNAPKTVPSGDISVSFERETEMRTPVTYAHNGDSTGFAGTWAELA